MEASDEEFEDALDFTAEEVQVKSTESPEDNESPTSQEIPAPYDISVQSIGTDFARLCWKCPNGIFKFELRCSSSTPFSTQTLSQNYAEVSGLCPGTEYTFTVAAVSENGNQSSTAQVSAYTIPNPPESIKVTSIGSTSVTLTWNPSTSLEKKYHVVCSHNSRTVYEEVTEMNMLIINKLAPGKTYSFYIATVLPNGSSSKSAMSSAHTQTTLESFLQDLGLKQHLTDKLSMRNVLQIDNSTVTDDAAQSPSDLPWLFLKKIMMVNVTARSVKCNPSIEEGDDASLDLYSDLDSLVLHQELSHKVNPLDIITAIFLCSDSFLQQEIALKMTMCQFSVPLLLPNCDTQQSMLMLWALRDIVKKFRPHSLSDPRGFVEDRIVLADLPLVSFVRLGDCSISKSQILNKLFSNPQQYHDTFVHYDMECGDIPRKISNGLVEISWYLPCGSKNIDIFPEPVAVANLRGDISTFETQYSFLCQMSTAIFVFFDNFDTNCQLLTNTHVKAQLFLVGNAQSKAFNLDLLKKTATAMHLKKSNIILKTKQNDADFVNNLCSAVSDVVKNKCTTVQVERMTTVAYEFGISVDEDKEECKNAKRNANEITNQIQDIVKFKEKQLLLQGELWKKLGKIEKEECRLRKAGDKNIQMYKSELAEQKQKLRKHQSSYEMSVAMTCFISALSSSSLERSYFLKWMRINLDNLSRKKLSHLREMYKFKCQESSEKKEEIAQLDREISNSALGIEHFLREMGQLYESAVSLPDEYIQSREQMLHLPKLCAQLMLEGFPVELVDGDASNIPLKWISDVLKELNILVKPKNKLMVVTVLGVQSTGKSTLLNTMFGVQFAVSSGRCTRGAFMLLIKISDNFKERLNCDYLVIIDTEGLKSPELAQLDDSHEHDNELATLVVGLSDITIINIAMENSTEMKDILQIVVHAFLRMKEVGKKPMCAFVHQNVADVSAHDKNMRDRKLLLEQLNEMTEAAAKMENKEMYKKFTDVLEYDPETGNWYIPGLWHGNPPMAPVNAGYSEAVYDFKKKMLNIIGNKKSTNNIEEFLEWTKSLWNAVKYENFIFSFRNSLVADAYRRLCTEFHNWEWSFKKDMYKWLTSAETRVSNFEIMKLKSDKTNLQDLLVILKGEASLELGKLERSILENLSKYFEQTEGHVYLVEKYKEDFVNSAKSIRRETENSVLDKLESVIEIRTGKNNLDKIKKTHSDKMEKKIVKLLEELRRNRCSETMSEKELNESFESMWQETLAELSFKGLQRKTIADTVFHQLRMNMEQKGSSVSQKLNEVNLDQYGKGKFVVTPESFLRKCINLFYSEQTVRLQELADCVFNECMHSINEKRKTKTDYHDTYIQEILRIIDDKFISSKNLGFSEKFELALKLHICAITAREFQAMHNRFIEENDPRRCLEQFKERYRADFKDLFNNRDQCQRKAGEFTKLCLKPAVDTFICNSLGLDVIDTMLQGENAFQFSTRSYFQYSILKQLLDDSDFENYKRYIRHYERFVKEWILKQIKNRFSKGNKLFELEEQHLSGATMEIKEAIRKAQHGTDEKNGIKVFIQNICRELGTKFVIPNDVLKAVMVLNNAEQKQFAHWLTQSVNEMQESLKADFKKDDIQSKLETLKIRPQDVLFKRVFGCGEQCPFCNAPCEAGGDAHTHHSTSVHRPQGLGLYMYVHSEKLVTNICSTDVNSESKFRCLETQGQYHPYKNYRAIFPDWHIPADPSIEASDYWKYVMAKFNNQFAEAYNAKPADIPPVWKQITKREAEKALNECFSIK